MHQSVITCPHTTKFFFLIFISAAKISANGGAPSRILGVTNTDLRASSQLLIECYGHFLFFHKIVGSALSRVEALAK